MREAIGGSWIFTIVIVFIVLFSSYLAISVNYSKAFKVKNGIISIIEKGEGFNNTTREEIADYLDSQGYYTYGDCQSEVTEDENGNLVSETGYEQITTSSKYKYCVSKTTSSSSDGGLVKTYYRVRVFFKMDLPVIGNLLTFPVVGETKAVYFANDDL